MESVDYLWCVWVFIMSSIPKKPVPHMTNSYCTKAHKDTDINMNNISAPRRRDRWLCWWRKARGLVAGTIGGANAGITTTNPRRIAIRFRLQKTAAREHLITFNTSIQKLKNLVTSNKIQYYKFLQRALARTTGRNRHAL